MTTIPWLARPRTLTMRLLTVPGAGSSPNEAGMAMLKLKDDKREQHWTIMSIVMMMVVVLLHENHPSPLFQPPACLPAPSPLPSYPLPSSSLARASVVTSSVLHHTTTHTITMTRQHPLSPPLHSPSPLSPLPTNPCPSLPSSLTGSCRWHPRSGPR